MPVYKSTYIGSSIEPITGKTVYSAPYPVIIFNIPFTSAERSRFSKFKQAEFIAGRVDVEFDQRSIINRPVEGKIALDMLVEANREQIVIDQANALEERYLNVYPERI